MGQLWANAPGPRVSAGQAGQLGDQTSAGARVDQAAKAITTSTSTVRLVAVAGPAGGPDETFRIAGLVNPAITVPVGAKVSIEVINADPDTAHGLVITASQNISSPMPMMTSRPAFTGSALWFLDNPTAAGMHIAPPHLHRQHARHLPLHVPCPRPRPGRNDRGLHRQQLQLVTSKARLARNRSTGRVVLVPV